MSDEMKDFDIELLEEEWNTITTKFEPYVGKEPYLFVSYSHKNMNEVYPVLDKLYDNKFRIWYDESCENGNDFRDELRDRIQASKAVLLFVSEDSMASPFCGMEIITAKECGKRIFPIFVDGSEFPPAFSLMFSNTHYSQITDSKLIKNLVRDLPAEAMDRLTIDEDELITCEDNGNEITIDEGTRIIRSNAFRRKRSLEHIHMPESLEVIESESFRECSSLKEMIIPDKTTKIGDSAFRDCGKLKKLVITNSCIKIGERAFENCSSLVDITLPDGLTEIYGGVFNSCKSLKSIKLPSFLTILGESAFSDCIGLEEFDVPETVTKIDDLVFNGCTNLESVQLNEGLKKIGKGAFKNCKSLKRIDIPTTVSSISDAPFRGCDSIRSIKVAPKNKYYKSEPNKREGKDHVLFNKNKSVLIAYPASSREVQYDVPDSVTTISDWAFCECKKLNRVTIPDSVTSIGEGAFCNCDLLDDIEIPDSVEKIDDCAFRGCLKLEKVVVPSSVRDIGWGVFDGCENNLVVYCDEGSDIYEYCKRIEIEVRSIEEKEFD